MNDITLFLIIIFILLISIGLTLILFYNSNSNGNGNGGSGTGIETDCPTIQQAMSGTYTGEWVIKMELVSNPPPSSGNNNVIETKGNLEKLFGENYKNYITLTTDGFKFLTDSNTKTYIEYIYSDGKYTAKLPSQTTQSDDGKTITISGTSTLKASNC